MIIQGQKIVKQFKEKVNLLVEFKPETSPAQIGLVIKKLESSDFVKEGSISFTSKDQAAEILREDFGEDFIKLGFNNPLYDVVTFNTKSEYMSSDSLAKIRTGFLERSNVNPVQAVVRMVSILRNFEAIQKSLNLITNDMNKQAIEKLSR